MDSLLWDRAYGRVERLFGMRYRIELYTPPARRVCRYFVCPFLFGARCWAAAT